MAFLVSIFFGLWCAVVVMGLIHYAGEKRRLDELLQAQGFRPEKKKRSDSEKRGKLSRLVDPILLRISFSEQLTAYFYQAGLPLRVEELAAAFLLAFLLAAVLVIGGHVPAGLVVAGLVIVLPPFWLARLRRKRLRRFNEQLSEALVLMANSLRAGFSFLQAMDLIGKEMPSPLGKEFSLVLKEINLGAGTEQSLLGLVDRVPSEDLEMVVTALLIQRQVGGNLTEVLEGISATIKERVRIQGEIKTLTAQGRISGIIIGLLPLVLAVVLGMINPEYVMVLATDAVGRVLIAGGIVSQLLGAMMIKRIVSIDV